MDAVAYYIIIFFVRLLTLLPLRVLYILSDFLFLLLCYFPSYRRKVVETNLRNSFPEKSAKEIRSIRNKFYRHLSDMFIEVLKLNSMGKKELNKRITFSGTEIMNRLYDENRDIVGLVGHYGNWEMMLMLQEQLKHKIYVVYKPLNNKYFDRLINSSRTKFGVGISPMSAIIKDILSCRKENIRTISIFLSDQTPPKPAIQYWTTFLNQDTPVYLGAEKIASKYDMAVVFFNVQKIKRGHYNLEFELLFDHTEGLPEHLITETHVKRLEEIIKEKPEYWLWSHRRWKHKKPVSNA